MQASDLGAVGSRVNLGTASTEACPACSAEVRAGTALQQELYLTHMSRSCGEVPQVRRQVHDDLGVLD